MPTTLSTLFEQFCRERHDPLQAPGYVTPIPPAATYSGDRNRLLKTRSVKVLIKDLDLTCPLKTNPNLERESKDSDVCKEVGNDEEAIHERTDYPQAEGSRS